MRRGALWFAVTAICFVAVVLAFRFQSAPVNTPRTTAPNPSPRSTSINEVTSAPSSSTSKSQDRQVAADMATADATPTFDTGDAKQRQAAAADTDLLAVKGMLRDYRAMMGENPVGNNAEISKVLLGRNSRGAQFSNSQTKLDKDGQLIDRWNHAYFFHQLSKIDMEVRSAGPDGVMWTPDDEVSP